MLIAFLILLGVDLIVVVVLAALLLGRRRWVKRQPGVFLGAIRVTSGHVEGLGPKWKRGYGRWARDVLVWTKAPLFFRNQLVPMDRIAGQRSAHRDEVRRLGGEPIVIQFESDKDKIEVATRPEHQALVSGPMSPPGA